MYIKNKVPPQGKANFEATSNGVKTAICIIVSENIRKNIIIKY